MVRIFLTESLLLGLFLPKVLVKGELPKPPVFGMEMHTPGPMNLWDKKENINSYVCLAHTFNFTFYNVTY